MRMGDAASESRVGRVGRVGLWGASVRCALMLFVDLFEAYEVELRCMLARR